MPVKEIERYSLMLFFLNKNLIRRLKMRLKSLNHYKAKDIESIPSQH